MNKRLKKGIAYILAAITVFAAVSARPVTVSAASVSDEAGLVKLANSGGTAKLIADISLSAMLVIPEGKKLTLDLNGKTLNRGLTECIEDGSAIYVEAGATLIVKDTTNTNAGIITGGAAFQGGGIRNYGTVTLSGGRIMENRADGHTRYLEDGTVAVDMTGGSVYDEGGGIYNGAGASLTLEGGIITGNSALYGGGVLSVSGGTLILRNGSYTKLENGKSVKVPTSVTVTGNQASDGSGIYNAGTLSVTGGAELSGNRNNDDIYLGDGVKIVCGELTSLKPAGLRAYGNDPAPGWNGLLPAADTKSKNITVTEGFGSNNPGKKAEQYFFSADTSVLIRLSAVENGEIELQKNPNTIMEVYENGQLINIIECDTPSTAWEQVPKYAKANPYYFLDAQSRSNSSWASGRYPNWATSDFVDWYDTMQGQIGLYDEETYLSKDPYVWAGYDIWEGYLKEDSQIKIILGSDWVLSDRLLVKRFNNIILDLNGHTVRRDGKKQKYGGLGYLEAFSKLTILDSNPNSAGYNGIKGGVFADGNGDDCGGGFVLSDYAELDMLGGTVYNCITDEHGGAVYTNNPRAKIVLKNCTFDSCRTKDSGDDCHGGALYIRNTMQVTIENVTFRNCYSEDDGGAIFMENRPGIVRMTNVTFENNEAKDRGGAIRVGDIDNKKQFLLECVNCSFTGNKAGQDGGAVYFTDNDDSVYKNPAIFRDCSFTRNTGKNGSALKLNDNSVLLTGCTITGNTASGKGAVYVDDGWKLSVAGKTVIKDNTNQNVILDKDGDKTRIYPAGLTEGAYIVINSDSGDKSTLMMKDIDRRQLQYFHVESGNGTLEYTKTGTREAGLTMASLFGNGSVWIVIGVAALAAAAAAVIIVKKRKEGAKDE